LKALLDTSRDSIRIRFLRFSSIVDDELGEMCDEVVVAFWKVLSKHFLEMTEQPRETLIYWTAGWRIDSGPP